MDAKKEILDAIEILIDRKMKSVARIYTGLIVAVRTDGKVRVRVDGNDYTIPYYGVEPTTNRSVPVFVPNNNMSLAFIISPG